MRYKQIHPPAYLRPYVRYFWTLESTEDHTETAVGPLVDGCPGIMFQPRTKGIFRDSKNLQLDEGFLFGQTLTRNNLYLTGNCDALGVCFQSDALKNVFGFDAYEFTDSCIHLDETKKKGESSIIERLHNTSSTKNRIAILSSYLYAHILKNQKKYGVDSITRLAVARIRVSNGGTSLWELQRELNLSERSLQRKFRQEVGISPKLFVKICRFQSSLMQMQRNDYIKLSDIAYDNGYADQAHFIRNFKEFAGVSPKKYAKQLLQEPNPYGEESISLNTQIDFLDQREVVALH